MQRAPAARMLSTRARAPRVRRIAARVWSRAASSRPSKRPTRSRRAAAKSSSPAMARAVMVATLRPYPSQVRQVIQSFPLHNRGIHVRYEEFFYPSLGRGQEDIHPLWVQLGPEVPHKPLWRGIFQRDFQCFSRRDPAYGARRGMRLGKAALLSGHKGENMLCHDRAGYTKSAPPASATSVRSLLRARETPLLLLACVPGQSPRCYDSWRPKFCNVVYPGLNGRGRGRPLCAKSGR
jgi:hypothetical protein